MDQLENLGEKKIMGCMQKSDKEGEQEVKLRKTRKKTFLAIAFPRGQNKMTC